MKELVYPTQYCALLVNLFVTLRQTDSSVEEKMVNYWAEICNVVFYVVKNVVKCCILHSNYLGFNQITKFTFNF